MEKFYVFTDSDWLKITIVEEVEKYDEICNY